MSVQKITSKLPQLPQLAPRGTNGARHSAPTAPPPYKGGAVGHGAAGATRKKKQLAKDYNTRLTDHEIELMRTMYEEFPAGHPKHIGQRKLAAIFCCSRAYAQNVVLYRRRR